jgi:hypothetical protein
MSHERVIVSGNIRDQGGQEVVSLLNGGEVALPGRVPGVAQLSPDVQRDEVVEADQRVARRGGKVLAGAIFELLLGSPHRREGAVLVPTQTGP